MNGILLNSGFQRAAGWCEGAIRTDRSTRERPVTNQDGDRPIQRTEWAGIPATWVAPRENLYLSSLIRDGRFLLYNENHTLGVWFRKASSYE